MVFKPLSAEERDLKTVIMAEPILMSGFNYNNYIGKLSSLRKYIAYPMYYLIFDKKINIDMSQKYCKILFDNTKKTLPEFNVSLSPDDSVFTYYNSMGNLFRVLFFSLREDSNQVRASFTCYVKHDLFIIKLARRMNKTLELTDPFTGQPYREDVEEGTVRSAGEDQKYYTDDDIVVEL
jgi:hypothetical protein